MLPKPVKPHGLRHAAITAALDVFQGDVRRVARFSRHRKVETVLLYDDRRRDLAGEIARSLEDLTVSMPAEPPPVPPSPTQPVPPRPSDPAKDA